MLQNVIDQSNPGRLIRDALIDWNHYVLGRILKNLVTREQTQKMENKTNNSGSQLLERQALNKRGILISIYSSIAQFT